MDIHNLTVNDFNEALFATNSDPMFIETKETAVYVKNFIENKTLSVLFPGDRDFPEVCAKLDLSAVNHPKKVYKIIDSNNTEVGYVAFSEDWD